MKNLIIIGAGGMGRSIYNLALECEGYKKDYIVKGFLDDNIHALDSFEGYPPVLSSVADYRVENGDVFTCSLGNVQLKKEFIMIIEGKGGDFISLISSLARVKTNAILGRGCIVEPFASIGCDASVGNHVLVQAFTVIGHDVHVGDWSRVDTHVTCVGESKIGNEVSIHTGAVINNKVVVEDRAFVGAGSFVVRRVKEGTTVYGNPARKL